MNKTYNVDAFGLPEWAVSQIAALGVQQMPLNYSGHAMREAINDRYGILPAAAFPKVFKWADNWSIVEVETASTTHRPRILTKFVVRRAVDANRSLVLVIARDGVDWNVKTLWTNLNNDQHATLDKSKFAKP